MKNHFPEGYCPQREKVIDLSRVVMSSGRTFARQRRAAGRHRDNRERQRVRRVLRQAERWLCECGSDGEIECFRCTSDILPALSETFGSSQRRSYDLDWRHIGSGVSDDLGPLIRWYRERTKHMSYDEVLDFLRTTFLASPFGHSLKTRHAYDHLCVQLKIDRGVDH